ncbi:plastocyanin/azurin family copper-binding protein [Dyadobacter sp. CY312]|uniref:plastocyanin/azurin family copper-binding protein n=1 Tax=Dyadobacter sp. CY312 TaxID=2907303 RepID=UPI001F18CED1|nr:plastocyanin/azurin family copper-binding protein [Dyadobacter sp. CY312]MCE7039356.1 plastocyanin/azurin family copper-binding protein [Dyadobacter sp. CY312]
MKNILLTTLISLGYFGAQAQFAQKKEDDYYRIITIPIPENIKMEVGGLQALPDGRLAASTRRGEVWMISNPYLKGDGRPSFKRFASGLHEPLGLLYRGKDFLISQRGEVTRLVDTDNDGVADVYDSFAKWPLSGNYHQYSYGPVKLPNGEMLVTLNLDWVGRGASQSKWRGWMLKLGDDGKLTPFATGLRSPSAFGSYKGDIFYTENQGDWVGSGRMTHLEKGDFAGNPAGLRWSGEEGSPVKLKPEDIPDTGEPLYDVAKRTPGLKAPAIWFPHTIIGISTAGFVEDATNGAFGPFAGQMFVGDQGHSIISRVDLEKVNGVWQGTVFPFREGFMSGILRLEWGLDGSIFVGQTSRGWSATGKSEFGIQRLVWTGKMPFEMKTVRSMPDGFEITFTSPIDKKSAAEQDAYKLSSFTYKYHHTYGSPIVNTDEVPLKGIIVSEDGLKVRLVVDPAVLRKGYVHEIKADGVRSAEGSNLLHGNGYYTLNEIAAGTPANSSQFTTTVKAGMDHSVHTAPAPETNAAPTAKRTAEMPASWTNGPDQVIIIGTVPGLKFDVSEIQVKAGSRIKIVFNNNDDMLHNLVITKPGTVNAVGEAGLNLGLKGSEMHYVPNTPDVLFHSNIVEPEKSEALYFTAPKQTGTYQYVCTFPGHYSLMQGKLKVTK